LDAGPGVLAGLGAAHGPEVQQLSWYQTGVLSPALGPDPAGPLKLSSKVVGSVVGVTGLVKAEETLSPMVLTAVTVNW
jgi:hypothetical protein